jgi:hypothetical protein
MAMARFPLKSSVIWSLAQYTPHYKSILIAGRGGQYDLGGSVGYFTTSVCTVVFHGTPNGIGLDYDYTLYGISCSN